MLQLAKVFQQPGFAKSCALLPSLGWCGISAVNVTLESPSQHPPSCLGARRGHCPWGQPSSAGVCLYVKLPVVKNTKPITSSAISTLQAPEQQKVAGCEKWAGNQNTRLLSLWHPHQTVQLWARQLIPNPPAILALPSLFGEQILCDRDGCPWVFVQCTAQ